jgi:hypothetical protein
VEAAAPLLEFARRHDLVRDRDALVVAGLVSTLLHLALLKWLVGYSQAPPIDAPVPETEIVLASPPDIESDKAPPAAKTALPPSTPMRAPEFQARLPSSDALPPEERREPKSEAWAQSRVILSSQELADPRNRKTVETLKHLEPQTRA